MSKSVSTTLEQKDYDALKALADEQDRNISGQVRHMLRKALNPLAMGGITLDDSHPHLLNPQ